MAALPLHLTQPCILPHPFTPAILAAPFARQHFPRLDVRTCNNLERFAGSMTQPKGFPPRPKTTVAMTLNATTIWDGIAMNSAWAYRLGVISIDKLATASMSRTPSRRRTLTGAWTTAAGATSNRVPPGGASCLGTGSCMSYTSTPVTVLLPNSTLYLFANERCVYPILSSPYRPDISQREIAPTQPLRAQPPTSSGRYSTCSAGACT